MWVSVRAAAAVAAEAAAGAGANAEAAVEVHGAAKAPQRIPSVSPAYRIASKVLDSEAEGSRPTGPARTQRTDAKVVPVGDCGVGLEE